MLTNRQYLSSDKVICPKIFVAQQQAPTHSTASVPLSFYYSMYLAKQLTSGRPQAQPTVELSTKMRRAEARTASKSAFFRRTSLYVWRAAS